jgi:hypothetical protein
VNGTAVKKAVGLWGQGRCGEHEARNTYIYIYIYMGYQKEQRNKRD